MSKLIFGRYDLATCLAFASYACCSIVIPMCLVAIAVDLHFPLEAGGMGRGGALQVARASSMMITMVLCGFCAGRWGKRVTLGGSILLMGLGVLMCALSPWYGLLFLALVVAGFGEGVIEGLATPFVQDIHPDQPGRYLNISHSFWSVGVVTLVLAAGALLQAGVYWRYIVGGVGLLTLIPALLFLWPNHGPTNPDHREEKVHWRDIIRKTKEIFSHRRFWLYFAMMFFAGGAEFCLTFWCASFIQIAYSGSAWAAGLGTAFFSSGMFLSRFGSGLWVRQNRLQRLIAGMAFLGIVTSLLLPYLSSITMLYALLFLAGIASGPFWPSIQSHGERRTPGDMTMMMILFSCAGIPGSGFFTWFMGFLGDIIGLRASFLMIPACFTVVLILICYDWVVESREQPVAKS